MSAYDLLVLSQPSSSEFIRSFIQLRFTYITWTSSISAFLITNAGTTNERLYSVSVQLPFTTSQGVDIF